MSRLTTLAEDILSAYNDLSRPICTENPQYAKWIEEHYIPEQMMEYLQLPGANPLLLSRRPEMNLSILKNSPHDTKMELPVQVVGWEQPQQGQYGMWCFMTVRDSSGQEKISYSPGKDNVWPQQNQTVTMRLTCKHKDRYRNLTGYIITQQNQAPPSQPPMPQPVPPSQPPAQQAYMPPQNKPTSNGTEKDKLIIAQVAAKIAADLYIAGSIKDVSTEEVMHFWANMIWNVSQKVGQGPTFEQKYNLPTDM